MPAKCTLGRYKGGHMQNAIIKGEGNSRYLKSVADFLTQYPDYESFAQALMTGTLPIDLNGINPAGWTQQGTPITAGTLLSDDTAERLGLENTEAATVNDALASLGGPASERLYKLVNESPAITSADLAASDLVPLADVSEAAGKKLTLSNLMGYINNRANRVQDSNSANATYMARGIAAGTADLTAGTSDLASGCIYLVYE